MALQESVAVRDAMNDARVRAIGESPTLEIRTGPPPANCAAPDVGDLIASGILPKVWLTPSEDGVMTKAGNWIVTGERAAGSGDRGGHYRIKQDGTCHQQGTFGYGADMVPSDNLISSGQAVNVTTFVLTRGNQ